MTKDDKFCIDIFEIDEIADHAWIVLRLFNEAATLKPPHESSA